MNNITIFIASRLNVNTGKGGVYFSLIAYKEILSNYYNTRVIHLNGLKHKTVIDEVTDIVLPFSSKKKHSILKNYFKENKPKIFISFTNHDLTLYIRWLCWLYRCKFIYVKAGGPNYPLKQFYTNAIFFSKENYLFCNGSRYVKGFTISNRIKPFVLNEKRLQDLKSLHTHPLNNTIKILRVSRLHKAYLAVFLATINLHKEMQNRGLSVLTHLIGHDEDPSVKIAIQNAIGSTKGITLYTEDYYTYNSKELIPFYDIIVGIGRGFWEGVACEKFTLGYVDNANIPVLVTEANIEVFKEANFEPRVKLPDLETFIDNINIYTSLENRKNYIKFLMDQFEANYSTVTLFQKLQKALNESEYEHLWLLVKSMLLSCYTSIRSKVKYHLNFNNSINLINKTSDKSVISKLQHK